MATYKLYDPNEGKLNKLACKIVGHYVNINDVGRMAQEGNCQRCGALVAIKVGLNEVKITGVIRES